jgi:hypothetical protein
MALVGATGSGRTTLTALVARLYDLTGGTDTGLEVCAGGRGALVSPEAALVHRMFGSTGRIVPLLVPRRGATYVQDRLGADRHDIAKLTRDRGANFYVCGDGQHMAPAVWDTCVHMYREGSGADESTRKPG